MQDFTACLRLASPGSCTECVEVDFRQTIREKIYVPDSLSWTLGFSHHAYPYSTRPRLLSPSKHRRQARPVPKTARARHSAAWRYRRRAWLCWSIPDRYAVADTV